MPLGGSNRFGDLAFAEVVPQSQHVTVGLPGSLEEGKSAFNHDVDRPNRHNAHACQDELVNQWGRFPDLDETSVMIKAIRDMNLPKFIAEDVVLFDNMFMDLFPDCEEPQVNMDVRASW